MLFLRAAALLPLISLSLRLRGFRKTQAFLQKFLSLPNHQVDTFASNRTELTVRMVRAAVRYSPGHPTCLDESMTLWWLLERQGIGAELKVGVRKNGEKFEAHAWVERGGLALNEPESKHKHFAAFDTALASLPPEPR